MVENLLQIMSCRQRGQLQKKECDSKQQDVKITARRGNGDKISFRAAFQRLNCMKRISTFLLAITLNDAPKAQFS